MTFLSQLFSISSEASDAVEHGMGAGEYIKHHLAHWNTLGHPQDKLVDFSTVNIDTLIYSGLMGIIASLILLFAARRATAGVPGRFQAFVEMLVEMVESQSKSLIHGNRAFIAPLALTIFVWVSLMNCMDFLPLDLLPSVAQKIGAGMGMDPHHVYQRVVPTADLNGTMGIALAVLVLMIFYSFKIKGVGGFIHELFTAPFGSNPLLMPFNFVLNLIEFIAKAVSLGMRLFGNMFAGELVFMLIALLGASASASLGGGLFFVGHLLAGSIWAIFHILVVFLQAYIFMMLTLIYLGQSHDAH